MMNNWRNASRKAVKHFWATRESQALKQGGATGAKDQGFRAAVTGGKQMDGFVNLVLVLLCDAGIEEACVYCERNLEVPGYYRPEKRWDLIVVADETLLASIEFKSQVGPSFGNNFNNRTEEALGSATDLWAAYREGAFRESQRPWLGYLCCWKTARVLPLHRRSGATFHSFRGIPWIIRTKNDMRSF